MRLRSFAAVALAAAWFAGPAVSLPDLDLPPLESKVVAPDGAAIDYFGLKVAMDGDVAIVGADHHDHAVDNAGAAYILERDALGMWNVVQELGASDPTPWAWFGRDVAADDGTVVATADGAILAPGQDPVGAAYVFEKEGDEWTQRAKLTPAAYQNSGYMFGHRAAISGDTILVTSPAYDACLGVWDASGHCRNAQNPNFPAPRYFDVGAVHEFLRSPNGEWVRGQVILAPDWTSTELFGASVAVDGDHAVISNMRAHLYFFERVNGTWTSQAQFEGSSFLYGFDLDIAGDDAMVGDYAYDGAGTDTGAVFVYRRSSQGTWALDQTLYADDPTTGSDFGGALALDANVAVIGAYGLDIVEENSGAAYVFRRGDDGAWSQDRKLTPADAAPSQWYGISTAISGSVALVGAYADDDRGEDAGAAYVYRFLPEDAVPA